MDTIHRRGERRARRSDRWTSSKSSRTRTPSAIVKFEACKRQGSRRAPRGVRRPSPRSAPLPPSLWLARQPAGSRPGKAADLPRRGVPPVRRATSVGRLRQRFVSTRASTSALTRSAGPAVPDGGLDRPQQQLGRRRRRRTSSNTLPCGRRRQGDGRCAASTSRGEYTGHRRRP